MLLLSSSAHHIYWLGRYLFRIGHVASHLPFCDDEQAADVINRGVQSWRIKYIKESAKAPGACL